MSIVLPEGYSVRDGRLALNVKVYRGATPAEVAEVGAELAVGGRLEARGLCSRASRRTR